MKPFKKYRSDCSVSKIPNYFLIVIIFLNYMEMDLTKKNSTYKNVVFTKMRSHGKIYVEVFMSSNIIKYTDSFYFSTCCIFSLKYCLIATM